MKRFLARSLTLPEAGVAQRSGGAVVRSILYVSIGAAARSNQGTLFHTFEQVDRGSTSTSTMMAVSVDPRASSHVFCAARHGLVFGSLDDGAIWTTYHLPETAKEVLGLAVGLYQF